MSEPKKIQTVALVNPLGDLGISSYVYELAEGLAANGVEVDVYTNETCKFSARPRHHRLFPVIGSPLYAQRNKLQDEPDASPTNGEGPIVGTAHPDSVVRKSHAMNRFWVLRQLRNSLLAGELVLHLRKRKYDVIWTQWPDIYGNWFWRFARPLGMPLVHTVHNVLPHEPSTKARRQCRQVYASSDCLLVHSEYARRELVEFMPTAASKVAIQWHGMHSIFRRNPGARERIRARLSIAQDEVAVLFCGAIRPYKNLDPVLHAVRQNGAGRIVLVVAGKEGGFPDCDPKDNLGRARRLAAELGISAQVRLLPGWLTFDEMGELFEACDILMVVYEKHYGSGLLLQGMAYGIHIVATITGGADEYLRRYPNCTLLPGSDTSQISSGLAQAVSRLSSTNNRKHLSPEFNWSRIARNTIDTLRGFYAER